MGRVIAVPTWSDLAWLGALATWAPEDPGHADVASGRGELSRRSLIRGTALLFLSENRFTPFVHLAKKF
ncbi:hypothetical protein [Oceanobacillus picturae]|uniref:hypothetical protein n=1 Tax=Oceanobacillus picturae TaxID=171693 RepID=UPI0011C35DFF|nr:hypothetical protein [Oceanobacillus picturae]